MRGHINSVVVRWLLRDDVTDERARSGRSSICKGLSNGDHFVCCVTRSHRSCPITPSLDNERFITRDVNERILTSKEEENFVLTMNSPFGGHAQDCGEPTISK